ncbi:MULTISPECIES: response regulator transcription factor [unclassified Variovorax]|uniref:response regulator transcription factor n=1 Tax=unclassified Variovorax TaxID=663243 RepID=UPI0034E97D1F
MNRANASCDDVEEKIQALRVALIVEGVEDSEVLRNCVEFIVGCRVVSFDALQALESGLHSGEKFDLLLISLRNASDSYLSQVRAIRDLTCASAIFLLHNSDLWKLQGISADYLGLSFTDFLLAPFELRELRLRLGMMARRIASAQSDQDLILQDYHFRVRSRTVLYQGSLVHLSPQEFKLAFELFRNMGRVLTRDWLLRTIWAHDSAPRTVDVCASNLRKKLKLHPGNSFTLRSVYGHGYQLAGGEVSHLELSGNRVQGASV